ncbi:PspA/IM30 family protein [Pseudoalteromonas aurantia]|uniref:Phage shock protein A n=1 Tax=Pseudoalteromonas aurantia 208 TaxID=1314867 RepID=A0ABR9EG59_9GAMM|nr:PspA/IM30 family protein [Pseudoalteromonas aurantia]MBE0369215.1 hypothetical protein [Pseudoalteromonas aurantia 208]
MALINRIEDIIKSEVSAFLDKAEDPQKMTSHIKTELRDALAECRAMAATIICEQKALTRQIETKQKQADDWQQKAEHALTKARDDLAKAALNHKHTLIGQVDELQPQQLKLAQALEQLNADADRLITKINALSHTEQQLLRRERVVSAQVRVRQVLASDNVDNVLARFEYLERKVERIESEVESYDVGQQSTQAQFDALDKEEKLSSELALLKQQIAARTSQVSA